MGDAAANTRKKPRRSHLKGCGANVAGIVRVHRHVRPAARAEVEHAFVHDRVAKDDTAARRRGLSMVHVVGSAFRLSAPK